MTAPITTEEIGRWISDDRNHGVNVNSGVLSDMCCEIIRNRAKLESAEKLADAAENLGIAVSMGWDVDGVVANLRSALTAWEAAK